MESKRSVVFCADDLGISRGTNEGIARAVENGIVRESSLCVTGVAVEEGAALAKELAPRLATGLHLSLTLGKALSGRIAGLTDREGRFHRLPTVLLRCLLRAVPRKRLREEIAAQLGRVEELGLPLSHLNGHHHVHSFPVLRELVLELAAERGIPYLRVPSELAITGGGSGARSFVLRRLARGFRSRLDASGLPGGLAFLGLELYDREDYEAAFLSAARQLPSGPVEWMVHPRTADEEFRELDHLDEASDRRAALEQRFLSDPSLPGRLEELGILPCSFAEAGYPLG